MKTPRVLAVAAASVVLLLAAITLAALEGLEVAVLRTGLGTDQPHETRVWVADFAGSPWIEAANPEREFYRDILADPKVELTRDGRRFSYRAWPVMDGSGHGLIRSLLSEKYGWADRWIGLIADTSQSIALRLEPR